MSESEIMSLEKLYLEKRLSLTESSAKESTDDSMQDSTDDSMEDLTEEQYIERKLHKMEISDKEVEDISTENTPKKEQTILSPYLCMNLLPDEESIKFIIGGKPHVISKKSLCATNSSYFKNICLTHKEIDMTNELVTDKEIRSFYQILLYIATGSIEQKDYWTLKDLLTAADKYDVPRLKLICERNLICCITIDNAIELLQFALSSNTKFLARLSKIYIKYYIERIKNTKEFRDLPQENLNKIMEFIGES
ncbi:protein maternal effect lethal 26-like [Temnothorax curvispinosus]|uniref:Protein maternal effect lethal 26-like n=1 Tax=Temnothorax curvispinosus TaxID=300111 RepID=A0A6J1QC91_9HYME|nr:protein maternal effect lethal 26-like [Temnothorax curvispinosus]XP_024878376.1 protein maternal effect lethal 26-like [Temnothorax curvispinosus]